MNLARAVQVSIDTAVQPCEDQKVAGVQSMHPSVGDWGGCSMSLVGHSWVVMHILCDKWLLFMNGLGGHSSLFGGFEGVQLLLFMGSCCLWVVLYDGQSLFVNGLGGHSSLFGGFEGVQLLSFMGDHPRFVSWRVVIICGWLEWVLLISGGLLWVMGGCFVVICGRLGICLEGGCFVLFVGGCARFVWWVVMGHGSLG